MKARALLGLLAVAALAGSASGAVILQDNFDSYANQAAMDAVYTQLYPTYPALLEQTKGFSDGQSVHFGLPTANSQKRMYKNLGQEAAGSDAQPLKFEAMIDLDTLVWSTRQMIELRGYSGAGYNDGSLQELIALGCTSSGVDTSKYNGRVITTTGQLANGYFNLTAKTLEWTKLTALIKTSTVEVYVNDSLITTVTRNPAFTLDCIVIGSGLSSAGADVWIDNVIVERVPEPATMALLALGALPMLRRRRTA